MTDRNNAGAIWKNERREKDTHPHFTGSAIIEGVEYWVSAWKRDEHAKENSPALKFVFTRKEKRPASPAAQEDFNDDIPF
jgi:hypothetical protein